MFFVISFRLSIFRLTVLLLIVSILCYMEKVPRNDRNTSIAGIENKHRLAIKVKHFYFIYHLILSVLIRWNVYLFLQTWNMCF